MKKKNMIFLLFEQKTLLCIKVDTSSVANIKNLSLSQFKYLKFIWCTKSIRKVRENSFKTLQNT